jgi:hypothetical protein
VCPSCSRLVGATLPPSPPRKDCTHCGHWHDEKPQLGCACCESSYDDADFLFTDHEPTATDVLFCASQFGSPVTREHVLGRFRQEVRAKVARLFDVLIRTGRVIPVRDDPQIGAELYQPAEPPAVPVLPPTPDRTPITLEEVANYVRKLRVPTKVIWAFRVAPELRPLDFASYIAPGVKASCEDYTSGHRLAKRSVDHQIYDALKRDVESHLSTLRDFGWIDHGRAGGYQKLWSIKSLIARKEATDIKRAETSEGPESVESAEHDSPTDAIETTLETSK